jgi:hypothetical protein
MKHQFFYLFLFCFFESAAQMPEDALRMAWTTPSGTARQQAIGGAMCSLGGEISSAYVNPAGLGFYNTSEIVFSPGLSFQSIKSSYLGTPSTGSQVFNFNLGTSGIVLGGTMEEGNAITLSFAVNRTANFNGNLYYSGKNNYSSFSEQYAEEFANSNLSIHDGINNPLLSYGTRMALYTYLIDTVTVGSAQQVIGMPEKVLAANGSLNQVYDSRTKGGITELNIAVGIAGTSRWLFGGSLGIPIINYTRNLTFSESDVSGNANNDFKSSTYSETYNSSGGGVNLRLGTIFIASHSFRIGLAVQTPTICFLTDKLSASMTTNTENYADSVSITSSALDAAIGLNAGNVKYDVTLPWKFTAGLSYLLGSVEDVKKQKGFITADVEYLTTRSPRYSSPEVDGTSVQGSYFSPLNDVIKNYYRNIFNFRVGAEVKFNIISAQAGFAYYGNPYADSRVRGERMYISGGIGYRNKGIFVDLAYIHGIVHDVSFPYRLTDKANSYASASQSAGTVLATVGLKF